MNITRPKFEVTPLQAGLSWGNDAGGRYEEKLDGVWHVKDWQGYTLAGELMRDGRFYAFDCLGLQGQDLRTCPLRERLAVLNGLSDVLRPVAGLHGGDLLRDVLSRNGEGIVAKRFDEPFGATWFKVKRSETFDLIVTEKDILRGSLRLHDGVTREDRGWCPCKKEFDHVAVGETVEVTGYGMTANGKVREPRFTRLRPDKC